MFDERCLRKVVWEIELTEARLTLRKALFYSIAFFCSLRKTTCWFVLILRSIASFDLAAVLKTKCFYEEKKEIESVSLKFVVLVPHMLFVLNWASFINTPIAGAQASTGKHIFRRSAFCLSYFALVLVTLLFVTRNKQMLGSRKMILLPWRELRCRLHCYDAALLPVLPTVICRMT